MPLPCDVDYNIKQQRVGIYATYGRHVQNLTIDARLVHDMTGGSFNELCLAVTHSPSLGPECRVLSLALEHDEQISLEVCTLRQLVRSIRQGDEPTDNESVFELTFAPLSHGNLFGWIRYAGLLVQDLTFNIDYGDFIRSFYDSSSPIQRAFAFYPVIALIASIIVLTGLGTLCDALQLMRESVPMRTPVAGHDALLDVLVGFPFNGKIWGTREVWDLEVEDGHLWKRPSAQYPSGLRPKTQWKAMIMHTKHRRSPLGEGLDE